MGTEGTRRQKTGHRTLSPLPATFGVFLPQNLDCTLAHIFHSPHPQPPIPSQRMFGTHWRRPSRPTSRSLCKLLTCVHHVPDTPGGAVPAQDTQQGEEKRRCASSIPGKELLRVRALSPAPSPVPTLFGLLSAGGRNRWVRPESKCSPLGLSVAEIRMRPRVLTQHHGWS